MSHCNFYQSRYSEVWGWMCFLGVTEVRLVLLIWTKSRLLDAARNRAVICFQGTLLNDPHGFRFLSYVHSLIQSFCKPLSSPTSSYVHPPHLVLGSIHTLVKPPCVCTLLSSCWKCKGMWIWGWGDSDRLCSKWVIEGSPLKGEGAWVRLTKKVQDERDHMTPERVRRSVPEFPFLVSVYSTFSVLHFLLLGFCKICIFTSKPPSSGR